MCCEGLIDKFPQLDSCCFCFKVETGSKIIAWLGAIAAFIYTVVITAGLVTLAVGASKATDEGNKGGIIAASLVFSAIILIFLVFFWTMALVLLIGLYKDDMGKVKLWLRVNICLFFFGAVGAILNIISAISSSHEPAGAIVTVIISAIFQILFSLYMISVVKSYYYNKTQGFETVRA